MERPLCATLHPSIFRVLAHHSADLSEHRFLSSSHLRRLCGLMVIPSAEMHETMDQIEGEFVVERLTMFPALTQGGVGTDENFPMVKGDYVGRSRVIEKLRMNTGHFFIPNDAEFDLVELQQWRIRRFDL